MTPTPQRWSLWIFHREFPNNSTVMIPYLSPGKTVPPNQSKPVFWEKHTAFEMNSVSMNSESHVFVEFDVSMRTSPSNLNCIWIRSLPFVSLVEGVQHFAPSQWQSHDNAMWEPSAGYHHNAQHALAGSALKLYTFDDSTRCWIGVNVYGNNGTAERLLLLRIVPWHLKTMLCLLLDMKLNLYPQTCKWKSPFYYRRYIFKRSIFHCYVSLPECTTSEQSIWDSPLFFHAQKSSSRPPEMPSLYRPLLHIFRATKNHSYGGHCYHSFSSGISSL